MDREDRRLGIVRARQHDLELELVELAAQPSDTLGDLGVEAAVVARLRRQLQQDPEILGGAGELGHAGHAPGQLRPLAEDLLGAPVVLPERRRRHLDVEGGQALLLARDVKDAPGARRPVAPAR
jgi:hypothetical protein